MECILLEERGNCREAVAMEKKQKETFINY